jgi:hypothetical protein
MDVAAARAYFRSPPPKEIVMSKSPRILAPAVAALALAAPNAQARPAIDGPNHNSAVHAAAPAAPVQPSADGFDWGSAAIGAGGAATLVALLSAGAAAAWRVRAPSTR